VRIMIPARVIQLGGLWPALLMLSLLAGCTAGWKAPLETRGGPPPRRTQEHKPPPIQADRYRVRRGDTLYAIAWRSGQDFRRLARWNGIRAPYTIYPGQVLRLTPPSHPARSAANTRRPVRSKDSSTVAKRASPTRPATTPSVKQRPDGALHWVWPVRGPLLSRFSARDATHTGIKIGGRPGAPIKAAESGRVVYSGDGLIGYGQLIIIKHNDNYLSAYGHNAKLLVKEGDKVARGRHIADMGRANDGKPMLHFEIRREGRPVNPLALLPR